MTRKPGHRDELDLSTRHHLSVEVRTARGVDGPYVPPCRAETGYRAWLRFSDDMASVRITSKLENNTRRCRAGVLVIEPVISSLVFDMSTNLKL